MDDFKLEPAHDLALSPRERSRSLQRENGLIAAGCCVLAGLATRAYLRLYHRLTVTGREHLPKRPPFVLAANHSSHLDALTLAAPLPLAVRDRVFPLAAGDTFFTSSAKAICAAGLLNALPLWRRGPTAYDLLELRSRLIGEPCAFIVFPEGTRSRTGEMASFKPGVGMLLAGTTVPAVPCRLRGCFAACPPGRKLPRPRRIELRIGPPLTFGNVPEGRAGWQAVARTLEEAVRGLE